jgi:hypothetical protein
MSESAPSTQKAKALTAEWPGQKPKEMVSVASNAKDRGISDLRMQCFDHCGS